MVRRAGAAELVERDVPEPREAQVVIAIKACSICGGDLHIYKGKHPSAPLPMALGHELAGEVIAIGSKVDLVAVGDRVTVEPVIACGLCPPCRRGEYGYCDNLSFHYRQGQGALADYFVADQRYVYKLPAHLSYEAGALIEPLAVAVHAVRRARIGLGDKVAIIGAGPIGILVTAVCKAAGARGDHCRRHRGRAAHDRFRHGGNEDAQFAPRIDSRRGSRPDRRSGHRQIFRMRRLRGDLRAVDAVSLQGRSRHHRGHLRATCHSDTRRPYSFPRRSPCKGPRAIAGISKPPWG